MNDDFGYKLIGKEEREDFLGYNSASDKTSLLPGFMIRGSKNVYKKESGTIASRPGLKRRGSASSTDAGVKASFEWETSVGTSRYLRVCNNKLQVESDIVTAGTYVWYDLLLTSTLLSPAASLTRFVFGTWWDDNDKKDRLLMVRGDDKILHWSGGMALVSAGSSGIAGGISGKAFGSNAGTGYVAGDILTVVESGASGGTLRVTSVSGGAITAFDIATAGQGYSVGGDRAVTGGTGSGFLVNVTAISTTYSITKQGSETWAELGFAIDQTGEKKIIINGAEFTYVAGEDTTTLTGVTTDTSSLTSGLIAIQSVMLADNMPIDSTPAYEADFIKVIGNQVWIGSYSSRLVFVSADVNDIGDTLGFANFVNNGALLSGDPDGLILDSQARGIGEKDGKIIIFGGLSDLYVLTPNFSLPVSQSVEPLTGGTSRLVIQKIEKKVLPGLQAALGHEFISNFGNDLVWIDQNNQLRALGSFANVNDIKPTTLSLAVQEELMEEDFTGGHLRAIDDTIYITAPNNGRDWMYQVREALTDLGQITSERLWQPPQVRGISRFAIMNGVIHGHSNVNPQVYQVWDTLQWWDDNPTDEEIPYSAVARFAYRHHGRRQGLVKMDKIYWEGYMNEGVDLNANIFIDYQGATTQQQVNINSIASPADFYANSAAVSFGQSGLGDNPLGDGILPEASEQDLVPKFRAITDVNPINCFEYCLEIYTTEANSRWELLVFGPNIILASQEAGFLRK